MDGAFVEPWSVACVVGGIASLAAGHVLALLARNERVLIEAKAKAKRLRREREAEIIEVDEAPEEPAAQAA
jgi:short-subunit dehydrogenase